MRYLVTLLILASCFFQSCSTLKFEKYYPAIADTKTIFFFSKDSANNKNGYYDTLICRVRNAGTFRKAKGIKKGIAILSPNAQVQGGVKPIDFFYFEHPDHTLEDSMYVTENSFSGLSCCFYKGRTYMGNITTKDQRYWQEFFPNLFPKAINIGVKYFYRNGDATQTFTFIRKDNVEINGKKYDDCLVMTVGDNFSGLKGNDTVWFAKNVGIIKWIKKTGHTGFSKNN